MNETRVKSNKTRKGIKFKSGGGNEGKNYICKRIGICRKMNVLYIFQLWVPGSNINNYIKNEMPK
mgnify:CR=1 FL=1